jgi:putative hydroxymethylpyrimidine transport system ATP-binding protein
MQTIENVSLTIQEASLLYAHVPLFTNLSLILPAGKCTCLLGPSGIGKTALLRCIAGLSSEATARITSNHTAPLSTLIDYLPQHPVLMPWLNVMDNIILGDRIRGMLPNKTRAEHLLETMGISRQRRSFPATLSGGEQQRAALARVLYEDRPVLLLDEPFSALDAITRYQLQTLVSTLLHKKTVLLVTHDPLEALRMAHHILLMQGSPALLTPLLLPKSHTPRDVRSADVQHHYTELLVQLSVAQGDAWKN